MTERVTICVTLTLRSPFLFRGLAGGAIGVDAAQLRDEDNNPVLPGTQFQGVLKEALCDLAAAAPGIITPQQIEALFGKASPEFATAGEYDKPWRGCAIFGDLTASCPKLNQETTRIEIDDERGTVQRGHLQVVELVAPYGDTVAFTGKIVLFWPDGQSGPIVAALDKALKLVPAIGAFKSAGFGEMVPESSTVRNAGQYRLKVPAAADTRDRIGFSMTFDRPLLVNTERITENAFLGADIVPGAVLKGALARKLELTDGSQGLSDYGKALTKLIISHAFPADAAGKPGGEALPLSVVSTPDGKQFGDSLNVKEPGLGLGVLLGGRPAWYQSDWKEGWAEEASKWLGHSEYQPPVRLPRTHTKIENGVAAEHQLYTVIARSARDPADVTKSQSFLFTIDLCRVPDDERERARRLIALLEEGLDGIGRTGATASFAPWPEGDAAPAAKSVAGRPDRFAVVLRTATVLTDPTTGLSAAEAYEAYWSTHVPGAKLIDFCARQELAGGYLGMRRRPWPDTYHPFVVTAAGSVFLLQGDIAKRLDILIRQGLPLPTFSHGAAALDWRNCPFVPESGFGEIRADHLFNNDLSAGVEHV